VANNINHLSALLKTKRRTQLVAKIDEFLVRSSTVRWDGLLHISGLGYPIEKQAQGLMGLDRPNADPKLQRIFDMGHAIHARYDGYLEGMAKMGLIRLINEPERGEDGKYLTEITNSKVGIPGVEWTVLDLEDQVVGTADAVIEILPDGLVTLIDFKSINSNGFAKIEAEAKPEHVWQAKGYAYYFAKMGLCYIDQAMIVYENKDNQELKEVMVNIDDLSAVPKRVADVWAKVAEMKQEALLQEDLSPALSQEGW
jgi:CRISPR/Cas system-associated exonuclease Cas4 (RecB family)